MIASPVAIAIIGFIGSVTTLSVIYVIHSGLRARARRPE